MTTADPVAATALSRAVLAVAGLLLAMGTALGAFGAHALKSRLTTARLQTFETGVRYHFYHALGLLAIGLVAGRIDTPPIRWAAVLVIAGIVLFCGSVYALAFGAPRALGAVAPVGGLALILGWVLFAVGVLGGI